MSVLASKLIAKAKVNNATTLDLGNCGLTSIPPALFELKQLEALYLCNEYWDYKKRKWIKSSNQGEPNRLSEIPQGIEQLQNLKILYINGDYNNKWAISNIEPLNKLKKLKALELSSNQISNIESLHNLQTLKSLYLRNNQISNIESFNNLRALQALELSSNQISNIEPLNNLRALQALYLISNQISNIESLNNLRALQVLYLNSNQISNIEPLNNLRALQVLYLISNKISNIEPLNNLQALQALYLRSNQISDIEPLNNLQALQSLDLRANQISNIEPLLNLIKKGIPVVLYNYASSKKIYINNNPVSIPPLEIVRQGNQAIIDYFEEIKEQGIAYLYEAKMLILGEGGAGKTSLATKLLDVNQDLPTEAETTKGIDVNKWQFQTNKDNTFTINIWDFGGQEIYHFTHQFFLTKRSLYILLDDTRKDGKNIEDAVFKYWLETAKLFGAGSPLLIVQNEKGDRSKDIDLRSMQGQFDFIKDKYAVNLAKCDRLPAIKDAIQFYIQQLPHIGQALPKQWIPIRNELIHLAESTPYISLQHYYDICKKHQIRKKEKALFLSRYLHDLGTFLHFQEEALLKKTIILQNKWATDAVYKILDTESIKNNKGRFQRTALGNIWEENHYADMHDELLALMCKFELCYKLEDKQGHYLMPQLLPVSRPDAYYWDQTANLQLKYKYEFMPKGLLSRFIVRAHHYINDNDKLWRNGVNLVYEQNTFAEITETYAENEIAIRVRGTDQKTFMSIIVGIIDRLNSIFEGIKVSKDIPCNCATCINLTDPHFYDFKQIIRFYNGGKHTIDCYNEPFHEVIIAQLLTDLFDKLPEEWRKQGDKTPFDSTPKPPNINITNNVITAPTTSTPPLAPTSSKKNPPKPFYKEWWFARIAGGLGAGIFGSISAWWFWQVQPISAFLITFPIATAFLLYLGNPQRRFYKAAWVALAAGMSSLLLNLEMSLQFIQQLDDGNLIKGSFQWLSDYDWLIALALIALSAYLFYLDYKKD